MTPKWKLDAELSDTLERGLVAVNARRRRERESRDRTVARALWEQPDRMRRLLAAIPEESLVDRELHAAQVALAVAFFTNGNTTAATVPQKESK